MLYLLALVACDTVECEKGFERREDGLCYQIGETGAPLDTGQPDSAEPDESGSPETGGETADSSPVETGGETGDSAEDDVSTLEDLLDDLGDCELGIADGELNLDRHCVHDYCVGDTVADAEAAFGAPDETVVYFVRYGGIIYTVAYEQWANGIKIYFDDADADGILLETDHSTAIALDLPWGGGTEEGLGLGASLSCFVEALGYPDQVEFWTVGDGYGINYAFWSAFQLTVYDDALNGTGEFGISDGLVDGIFL